MEPMAIAALRAEWVARAGSPRSRRLLDELAAAEADIRQVGAVDLGELIEATSGRRGPMEPDQVHRVARALLRQLGHDELVGLAFVRMVLPGLLGVARRMRWGSGGPWKDGDEFAVDLVATAWTALPEQCGEPPERPCRAVVERVRRSLRTERDRHRRRMARQAPLPEGCSELASPGSDGLSQLARALALVSGVGIGRQDAALLVANRVLGYRLSELAAATGESVSSLSYRRRLAEAAICR